MLPSAVRLAAVLFLLGGAPVAAEIIGQRIDRAASEEQMTASLRRIELVDASGARLDLTALLANGKPTLITLWAHWCPNCRAEIAGFHKIAAACPDKWNIVFVSSRFEDYAEDLAKFRGFGLPWKIYGVSKRMASDPGEYDILRAFVGATSNGEVLTPLHYFVSSKGKVDMIVNARMDFAAPPRLAAFCADRP